jgi:hypothetical protein
MPSGSIAIDESQNHPDGPAARSEFSTVVGCCFVMKNPVEYPVFCPQKEHSWMRFVT